jgi:gamma-glutamylcyclotransferase (GGCT)/AIG2-like uncharacterized protein YtfP
MPHLFAYGTLMCEDIMQAAAGCRPSAVRGVLRGWSRRRVRGEDYPGLLPEEGARVEGVVYLDVPEGAWKRLDLFEGNMYARSSVCVELDDGSRLTAEAYVVRPEHAERLAEAGWDFEEFLRHGKTRFQSGYTGYTALEAGDP